MRLASSMSAERKPWAAILASDSALLEDSLQFLDGDYGTASRYIWLLGEVAETAPEQLYPFLPFLWQRLPEVQVPDTQRSLAKFMEYCGIPEEMEGEVIDTLFHWLNDFDTSKSCRYHTLRTLAKVVQKYPDFAEELRVSIESQMPVQNHVFRHYALKILKQLDEQQL